MKKDSKKYKLLEELAQWIEDTDDCGIELGVPGYLLMQKGRSIARRMIINLISDED